MAWCRRRKATLAVAFVIYLIHAAVLVFMYTTLKVPQHDQLLSLSLDQLLVQTISTPKYQPNISAADMWNKTNVNMAYLNKVLSFRHQPTNFRNRSTTILVLINSKPENYMIRKVIRNTWANAALAKQYGITTVFTMGSPGEKLKGQIVKEGNMYNDILVGNFLEGTRTGTLKFLLGLTWVAQNCSAAKFVFYGNDNIFVHFERLMDYLQSLEGDELHRAWHGKISSATKPVRDPKSVYYVPKELYPRKAFPEYCTAEAGFVLTSNAVKCLLEHSHHAPLVTIDDVFVSIIAEKLSFKLINNNAFSMHTMGKDGCLSTNVFTAGIKFKNASDFLPVYKNLEYPTTGQNCTDPNLELVLPRNISNAEYFDKTLQVSINHDDVCYDKTGETKNIFLIALISSLPSHFDRRRAIRETWGAQKQVLGKNIAVVFILGIETKDTALLRKKVREENDQKGDIIQAEFRESFHNLTLKVVTGLKWVTELCPNAKYVYKGDDDVFVNMKNIIGFLISLVKRSVGHCLWVMQCGPVFI